MLSGIMASVEQVMKEALALPSAARALLAEKLVESLEFDIVSQYNCIVSRYNRIVSQYNRIVSRCNNFPC